jgi:hypothetical protein
LSILFLGPEIIRRWRGETSFTIRNPWVVAFAFGLMHGLGFASALSSAGLPPAGVPRALLCFNVGVEFGQLAFIGSIVLLEQAARHVHPAWPRWVTMLPGYTVGGMGAFWTFQRLEVWLRAMGRSCPEAATMSAFYSAPGLPGTLVTSAPHRAMWSRRRSARYA